MRKYNLCAQLFSGNHLGLVRVHAEINQMGHLRSDSWRVESSHCHHTANNGIFVAVRNIAASDDNVAKE